MKIMALNKNTAAIINNTPKFRLDLRDWITADVGFIPFGPYVPSKYIAWYSLGENYANNVSRVEPDKLDIGRVVRVTGPVLEVQFGLGADVKLLEAIEVRHELYLLPFTTNLAICNDWIRDTLESNLSYPRPERTLGKFRNS